MAEMKVEIGFSNIDSINGLIDIVTRYVEKLPPEMISELEQLCEQGVYDFDTDYINSLGLDPSLCVVIADGREAARVLSVNPFRRDYVAYVGGGGEMARIKAASLRLSVGDYVVCEW